MFPKTPLSRAFQSTTILFALLSSAVSTTAQEGTWTTVAPMPQATSAFAAAKLGDKIYTVGGREGLSGGVVVAAVTNVLREYDPVTDNWTLLAPMPTSRENLAVVGAGGRLYAIGGNTTGFSNLTVVEEYDPTTDSWSTRAPLPTPTTSPTATSVNGKIYVFGGFGSAGSVEDTYEYDPASDTWTQRAPMPSRRSSAACATLNGRVFVVGGRRSPLQILTTVERFDPATDSWVTMAPMPLARADLGAVVVNNHLFAIGGNGPSRAVQSYDPETDTWQSVQAFMPTARVNHGVVSHGTEVLAFGGLSTGNNLVDTTERFSPFMASASKFGQACHRALTFAPNGFGGYGVTESVGDVLEPSGTSLGITGDDQMLSSIPLGFAFSWPDGAVTTDIDVDSNCRLLPGGSGDSADHSPSPSELLDELHATIAPFWSDFDITLGGDITLQTTATSATFTWDAVRQYFGDPDVGVTVQITLRDDGSFTVRYAGTAEFEEVVRNNRQAPALVGLSKGFGAVDPGETDISTLPIASSGFEPDFYEFFEANGEDLDLQMTLESRNLPVVGRTWDLEVTGVPPAAFASGILLGTTNPAIDLGLVPEFGMPGCFFLTSGDIGVLGTTVSLPVLDTGGLTLYLQAVALAPAGLHTPLGAVLSNGVVATTGI